MQRSALSIPRIALLTSVLFVVLAIGGVAQTKTGGDAFIWRDGDIVFQGSISPQCEAIEQATGSPWTHCGIVFTDASGPYVIEAVQPVRRTGLKEWLARGHNGVYAVRRLKEPLEPVTVERMKAVAKTFMGMDYDAYFQWDDERIYCSELVWKVYKQGAATEVGELERFGDMDLSGTEARRILGDRFGEKVPKDEPVVTPAAIFRSPLLVTVRSSDATSKKIARER